LSGSPHLEIWPLGQGDKSISFFGVQGPDTPYRRDVHTQSAQGSSLHGGRLDTHVFSTEDGQTSPHHAQAPLQYTLLLKLVQDIFSQSGNPQDYQRT